MKGKSGIRVTKGGDNCIIVGKIWQPSLDDSNKYRRNKNRFNKYFGNKFDRDF